MKGRDTIEIAHPAGEEIQWDWFERRQAPWGGTAYVLLGTLPHSSRVRGVLAESLDQAAPDRGHGRGDAPARRHAAGLAHRPAGHGDRAGHPRRAAVSFAPVAKHYGAVVEPCPPRRGNRKGAVESSVRFVCGRWWRTMTATTPQEAQRSLDRFCAGPGDARARRTADGGRTTVGELADAEPLLALPPVPVPGDDQREAGRRRQRDGRVPRQPLLGAARAGRRDVDAAATAWARRPSRSHRRPGALLAAHRLAPTAPAALVRTPEHRAELERVGARRVHHGPALRAQRQPPARRERPAPRRPGCSAGLGREVTVDLARLRRAGGGGPVSDGTQVYQQLARPPAPTLRLTAAAEALPAELEHAGRGQPRPHRVPRTAARARGHRHRARRQASLERFACLPAPWQTVRLRLRRPALGRPEAGQRAGHAAVPRRRHQRAVHRPARRRQDHARRRPGARLDRGRLPHLLHHRRRPGRPLPPGRPRRPVGHHHAVLRRTPAR